MFYYNNNNYYYYYYYYYYYFFFLSLSLLFNRYLCCITFTAPDRGRFILTGRWRLVAYDLCSLPWSPHSCACPSVHWERDILPFCQVESSCREFCLLGWTLRPSCQSSSSPWPFCQLESGNRLFSHVEWFLSDSEIWQLFQFWYSNSPSSHCVLFVRILHDPCRVESLSPRSISPTEDDLKQY